MISRNHAKVGALVPFTNTNLEPDLMMMVPAGVSLHFTRLGGYDQGEIPDEHQMAGLGTSDLQEPLRLLLGIQPDVILYGCTSATLAHGPSFDRDLAARIKKQSGALTITAAGALLHSLQALDIDQIGFASPYVSSLNNRAIEFLVDAGIKTVSRADIDGALSNLGQGALTPDDVFDLGYRADSAEAQALVLSCTDMRSVEVIERLEQALGKPVISSNQAMMFQTLQSLGVTDAPQGYGQLFERLAS